MALDPKFQVTDIAADRTEAILTDTTIYGDTNPERSDLAVYVQMYKVNEEGVRTLLATTPNNANPTVATTWTFALSVDGWYQADIIMIPVYDNTETYNEHDLVYSTNVYKSISASPITGNAPPSAAWTLVSSPTSEVALNGEATGAGNATFFIFNTIMTPNTEKYYGDLVVVEALACVGDCNIEEKVNSYEFIDLLLNAMYIACVRQQFANGEKLARRASQEFNC
jgi:hypothetical protein